MKVFTTGQVARIANVASRTVSKWFDSGMLKGYRIPGSKDRRIPEVYLIEFLDANGMPQLADLQRWADERDKDTNATLTGETNEPESR